MSVLLEFSMWPMDKGESVGAYVARSLEIVEASGLPYRLHAMGTILEGEWSQVFSVVDKCFEQMSRDSNRIACTIKVDWRRGRKDGLRSKVAGVEQHLGRKLVTD